MFDGGIVGMGWLTPEQIYEQITSGRGPRSLGDAQEVADAQGQLQSKINDRVRKLQTLMASGWIGKAGEQAANAATPVARVAEEASYKLDQAHQLIDQQRGGFERVSSQVTKMPPNPGEPSFVDEHLPMFSDHAEKAAAYQRAAQVNKDAFDQYNGVSTEVGSGMPTSYGTLKAATGDTHFELKTPDVGGQTPPDSGGFGEPGGSGPGGLPVGGSSPGGFGSPSSGGGAPGSGGGWQAPQTPAAQHSGPGGSSGSGSYDGGLGKYDDGSTSSAGYTTPGGMPHVPGTPGFPGSGSTGYPGSGVSGGNYGSGGAYGGGSGGGAYGGGAYGTGAAPGAGGGATGSRGGSLGTGRGSGAAPVGSSSGSGYPSSSSSSTSGGSRGMRPPMMGGAGGGKGQGGQDETHERPSYLEESDPESVFVGELPQVAPPVIGEQPPKRGQ